MERTEDFGAAPDQAINGEESSLIELIINQEALSVRSTLSMLRQASLERQRANA